MQHARMNRDRLTGARPVDEQPEHLGADAPMDHELLEVHGAARDRLCARGKRTHLDRIEVGSLRAGRQRRQDRRGVSDHVGIAADVVG